MLNKITYSIVLLVVHFILVYHVHFTGKTSYDDRIKNKKINPKIYDVGHKYLPNYSQNVYLKYLTDVVLYLPLLFGGWAVYYDYLSYSTIFYILRYITTAVTILPKEKGCPDESFGFMNLFQGHCYDKIFSGHFATSVLLSLLLYNYGIITNVVALLVYNSLMVYLILVTRSHYTVDLIIGGYIAATSYLLGWNVDFVRNLF